MGRNCSNILVATLLFLVYFVFISGLYYFVELRKINELDQEYGKICNSFGSKSIVLFRNDDISAISFLTREKRIFSIFKKYDIPQLIGVIPYVSENCSTCVGQKFHDLNESKAIIDYFKGLRDIGLVEIAQHGYKHCSNYLHDQAKNGLSEFSDLPYIEQKEMIMKGKQILQKAFGESIDIFIPPFNQLDFNTFSVLQDLGFEILSNGNYYFPPDSIVVIDCTTSLSELNDIISRNSAFLSPYFFVLYHSYQFNKEEDYIGLDSLLNKIVFDKRFQVMRVNDFSMVYSKKITRINALNNILRKYINDRWIAFYLVNHISRNISNRTFQDFHRALRLRNPKQISEISVDIFMANFCNFIIESFSIIVFWFIVLIISSKLAFQRFSIYLFLSILLIKIIEIVVVYLKYNVLLISISQIIFLLTFMIGFVLIIYYYNR